MDRFTLKNVGGYNPDKVCPFCEESGFDLIGLRIHLSQGHCPRYASLTDNADCPWCRIGAPCPVPHGEF